jgi:hypothetical protein
LARAKLALGDAKEFKEFAEKAMRSPGKKSSRIDSYQYVVGAYLENGYKAEALQYLEDLCAEDEVAHVFYPLYFQQILKTPSIREDLQSLRDGTLPRKEALQVLKDDPATSQNISFFFSDKKKEDLELSKFFAINSKTNILKFKSNAEKLINESNLSSETKVKLLAMLKKTQAQTLLDRMDNTYDFFTKPFWPKTAR